MKEVEMYSTVEGAVKAIIGNKVDQVGLYVLGSPECTSGRFSSQPVYA